MLERVKEELTNLQEKLRGAQDQLVDQADSLVHQARHRAHLVRGEGEERLWTLESQAIDWVYGLLERSDSPGVERVREPVGKLLNQARSSVFANPIEGYDKLNARAAANAVRELGVTGLLQIEKIEAAGKGRKTVYEAIERRRLELQKLPFRDKGAA